MTSQTERVKFIQKIYEEYSEVFDYGKPEMYFVKSSGRKRVIASLPLKNHLIHGETILHINEKIVEDNLEEYRYGWELSQRERKMGASTRHITAFDKQFKENPPYNNIKTNPFHHHHIPGQTSPRTETRVEFLEDVILILKDYLGSGKAYKCNHRFT